MSTLRALGPLLSFSLAIGAIGACHEPSAAQLGPAAPSTAAPARAPGAATASASEAITAGAGGAASEPSPPVAKAGSAQVIDAQPVPGPARASDGPPSLLDAEGKPLPQTDAKPSLESAHFRSLREALARAIKSGDPEPALGFFFPVVAYQQVKDVAKPERDYKYRLIANFKRDIAEYHRALGSAAGDAELESITVSEKDARWMAPGSEGNKLGYFRVLRSRLRFTWLAEGKSRSRDFELTSMISWRGEWYVVHLHGFK